MKKLLLALVSCAFIYQANAAVRIDIKNNTTDDCSVALNARIDKTTWLSTGWYVYMAGEEAPIILDNVDDIHNVFIYHDCNLKITDKDESKKVWVKSGKEFADEISMDNKPGYEEKDFIRLQSDKYTIEPSK